MADINEVINQSQANDLRLISLKLDTLQRDVGEIKNDFKVQLLDHETRLRVVELQKIPDLELEQAKIGERVNRYAMLQAAYTTIATVIATFLGART